MKKLMFNATLITGGAPHDYLIQIDLKDKSRVKKHHFKLSSPHPPYWTTIIVQTSKNRQEYVSFYTNTEIAQKSIERAISTFLLPTNPQETLYLGFEENLHGKMTINLDTFSSIPLFSPHTLKERKQNKL